MKKESILLLVVLSCNAKGVDCAPSSQSCVSTQVTDNSNDRENNTTINTDNTTVNVVTNTPVVNTPVEHTDAGATNNGGAGGSGNVAGAGGAIDASIDGGSTTEPVVCNSPNAIPTDVRNWFVTNRLSSDWFQLITANGFSTDRCTYTGKVKWFYEGPDGYWESDREYDSPETIITLRFEQNGDTKVSIHSPIDGYPIGYLNTSNIEYETCAPACVAEGTCGDNTCSSSSYSQRVCFRPGGGYHCESFRVSAFRGEWQLDHPVVMQQVYPPNSG